MKEVNKLYVHNPFNWKNPMSYLALGIRKCTKVFYNHAGLIIKIDNTFYVIHAVFPRIEIVEYETWVKQQERKTYIVPIDDKYNVEQVKKMALMQIGKKYDVMSLFIYMPLYILSNKWLGRVGKKSHKRLQCYELVSYVLEESESYKARPNL